MAAANVDREVPVEARVARLETNVEHILSDVTEIKVDVRRLNDKVDDVDKRLNAKIDDVDKRLSAEIKDVDRRLSAKIDDVKDSVTSLAVTVERGFSQLKVWTITLFLTFAAGSLIFVAQAFNWI